MFEDVKLVQGSSSLLAQNILPVGTERVPPFNDRVTKEKMLNDGCNEAEADEFIAKFGSERIKGGCISNTSGLINTLLGRAPVRPTRDTTSSGQRQSRAFVPPPAPAEMYKYVRLACAAPQEDVNKLAEIMRANNCYSQQVGTSGHGKGTRLSTLMEFFKYLGFNFEIQYLVNDKNAEKPNLQVIGSLCKELNMFVMGRWVKSNKSGLMSWSSLDTLTAGSNFDVAVSLTKQFKDHNYFAEGYVACFTSLWYANIMIPQGFTSIHKIGYEYDNKEQMLDRVMQRSGRPIKGDASWSQNTFARGVIDNDLKYFAENPQVPHTCFMTRFDAPVSIYGETFLKQIGAPQSIIDEFMAFCDSLSTLRHCNNLDENHKRFIAYKDMQDIDYKRAEQSDWSSFLKASVIIPDYYENNPNV